METFCHPSYTHPSHFLMLRQSLQTEILGSTNSQSIKSLNCTNYLTLVPSNLHFTRSAGPVPWPLKYVSHSEGFLRMFWEIIYLKGQSDGIFYTPQQGMDSLHCHCSSLASLSLQSYTIWYQHLSYHLGGMSHHQGGKAHSITFPYRKHSFPHKVATTRYLIDVLFLLYSQLS